MDLQPFEWINPCGYSGLATVDLRSLGVKASLLEVQEQLARALEQQLMP
jgi:lipoyl(octanoyl) transferase